MVIRKYNKKNEINLSISWGSFWNVLIWNWLELNGRLQMDKEEIPTIIAIDGVEASVKTVQTQIFIGNEKHSWDSYEDENGENVEIVKVCIEREETSTIIMCGNQLM